jgi:beta-glucosidase
MIGIIKSLIGPIVYGMGVSEADLTSYLTQLQGYVYAILILLVLLIIGLITAFGAKKGRRAFMRCQSIVAFIAAICVIVNMICWGPMKNNVSSVLNASKAELSEETVQASKDVIQKVGEEGIVMLKNDGLLPLSEDTKALNVFGWASTNPIFGGTGSGSSDASTAVGILGSLKSAGYETNQTLTDMYTAYRADRPTVAMQTQDWTLPEPTVEAYTDEIMNGAKDFSDTAVIVIGRSGGEGADLPTDMYAVIHGTYNVASQVSVAPDHMNYYNATYTNNGDYDDFDEGEHYLELSHTEEAMVTRVCDNFEKVIVIVNANNAMELGWVDEYDSIKAVLLAPGAGNTGFTAIGEILNGTVNPSGRTADTFVKDLTDTPTWNNFGNFSYTNVDDLKQTIAGLDGAYEGNMAFVNYVEGIYVGYKFYETAAEEGLINYEEKVQYPFGYGLSFTTFDEKIENFADGGDAVTFDVNVTNTGSTAGKDVVEIYFTPPYENGGIEKASVNLVDFAKTGIIEPGASETVSFTISKEDMAAYDSEGIKVNGGGYILEAGDYTISVRKDSHTVSDQASFTVDADVTGRTSDLIPAVNVFEDYARGSFTQLSRADHFANYAEATAAPADDAYVMSDDVRAEVEARSVAGYDPAAHDNADDVMPTVGADNGLKLADYRGVDIDDPSWEALLDQLSYEDMSLMINLGGWQTAAVPSVGKMATSDCDGPAGLSNFITGAYGTAYPAEVLMAMTWNPELINEMGIAMGQEYAEVNNYGWYGPAMNTHRNAFAGRNFEYFSEDGVLAGKMAAYEVNGAQTKGVYAYIKHFATNDQEGNRCSILLTYASEQAIREIYLKPFEMVVKNYQGTGLAAMSAFNWTGSIPACSNPNLLVTVLRDEWGFKGFVETDYNGSYGYQITDQCIRNGNDLMLGFASAATNVLSDQSATATIAMRNACRNIMYTIVNSGYYAEGSSAGGMDNMTKTFLGIDIAVAAVVILAEILLFRSRKKKA